MVVEDAATVVAAFCKLGGTRGTSKYVPGGIATPDDCDKLELLEALRRLSAPWPATNETRRGDEGWETRLGEALEWLKPDGD